MPHEIRVPRLGWSMEEGLFLGWCKQPGEQVAVGDPLFVLEGEKAAQEIESLDAGVLYVPPDAPEPGAAVAVGGLLGYLLAPDERLPARAPVPRSPAEKARVAEVSRGTSTAAPPAAAPSVRRLARELGLSLDGVTGTGPAGRIMRQDVIRHVRTPQEAGRSLGEATETVRPGDAGKPIASPRARRVAAELCVDWELLRGTGKEGRVREADVRAASRDLGRIEEAEPGRALDLSSGASSMRRRTIAARLRRSLEKTIPVTLTTVADATNLVGLRQQFKAAGASLVPAYTDLATALVALVLPRHPRLAIRWNEDRQSWVPIADDPLDVGIAVDSPHGLLVPVLRDVARKSLLRISRESQKLIERARAGQLSALEMQGGLFTITNLGGLGIDAFTPIIQYPEIAILGLGAIRREPVVLADDRIVPRDRLTLSLTFDHAIVDGAPAAAFLRDLASAMENAAAHLLDRS